MKRLALLVLAVLSIAFGSAAAPSDAKAANCFDAWQGSIGTTPALTEFCYQGRVWVSSTLLYDQYQSYTYMGSVYGTLRKYWGQNRYGQWNSVCFSYSQLFSNWPQVSCPF